MPIRNVVRLVIGLFVVVALLVILGIEATFIPFATSQGPFLSLTLLGMLVTAGGLSLVLSSMVAEFLRGRGILRRVRTELVMFIVGVILLSGGGAIVGYAFYTAGNTLAARYAITLPYAIVVAILGGMFLAGLAVNDSDDYRG